MANLTAEDRQRYEDTVRALVDLGHRGSTTEHEARAADLLAKGFEALGLEPERQAFRGSSTMGGRLLVHVVVAALGAALFWVSPIATITLGALAFFSLIAETTTRVAVLSAPLARRPSQNVFARIRPDGEVERRVVVLGHYDTQRTGRMWKPGVLDAVAPLLNRAPGVTKSPLFLVMLAMIAQVGLGIAALIFPGSGVVAGLLIPCLAIFALSGYLLGDWAKGPFVPGANDNATGAAAALTLAAAWQRNPVPGVEFIGLCPGCEETGLDGATAWAEKFGHHGPPLTFINIDSLGYGTPRFVGKEHSLAGVPVAYPEEMVRLAGQVATERGLTEAGPHVIPVASDAISFLVRGIPGITMHCFEDGGMMPNYHQMTDTCDRMSFDRAWAGMEFAWAVLRRWAENAEW